MARSEVEKEVLKPDDAREMLAAGDARVIDLRDDEEWDEAHILGAIRASEDDVESKAADFPEGMTIIVTCADGKQSAKVAESLRGGGHRAVSVDGGMKSWQSDQMPDHTRPDQEFEGPDYSKPPGA